MESYFKILFIVLLSLIMVASPTEGRKDPKDYWAHLMKDQDMPEAIRDFINQRSHESNEQEKAIKDLIKDFEPIPNVSVYHDDVKGKNVIKSSSNADCNLHHDNEVGVAPKKLAVADDFEPIPNVSVYND